MMTRTRAAILALLTLITSLCTSTIAARAESYVPISGSGSTWSQNALDQWRSNVARNYGMTINYNGVGSTSGRRDFIEGTVDFAVSEIPFQAKPEDGSAPEKPPVGYAYMPIVAGGTSFMYHLKINGKRVTNLRLSGETITKIFTGAITKWNDPAIKADNPGLTLPDRTVVPVIRSDGSGTSAQFTLWMSRQFPSLWTKGMTSQYPAFGNAKAQKGSDGVSGYVAQNFGEGAITYVEYSYAKKTGFPVAKLLNKSGYYVEPTAFSVAVALTKAVINSDLTQNLDGVYNSTDPRTYPLSSYSYMVVPTEIKPGRDIFDAEKGKTLGAFMRYVLCDGQQQADTLGYSPLPMNLVMAGSDQIKRIPGAGNTGIDFNNCKNPTFKAGDSPEKNQLAAVAPQPPACDKKGPTQCSTGTAGAKESTPVTKPNGSATTGGSTTGGSATGGATTGGSTTTGGVTTAGVEAAGAGTAAGAVPVYDEEGNLISGGAVTADGAAVGVAGTAVASPFTLPDRGMGPQEWLMVASVALLVAVVVIPAWLSPRFKGGVGRADG